MAMERERYTYHIAILFGEHDVVTFWGDGEPSLRPTHLVVLFCSVGDGELKEEMLGRSVRTRGKYGRYCTTMMVKKHMEETTE
jgi:hypothetical protein